MNSFDKVIGYSGVKAELNIVCDIIKNPNKYKPLGVTPPKGIILHGPIGIGKTLLANCFIEKCNINHFICRKNMPNDDFIKTIKNTFDKAKNCTPSIILLDDIDKYSSEDDSNNQEEYITIQSCIDDVKNLDVFVIATANSIFNLPKSLIRAGRFDINILMQPPKGNDAIEIIKYYINKKSYVDSLNIYEIGRILNGCSCAEVESIINEAGLYAGYSGKSKIEFCDLIKACTRSNLLTGNSLTDVATPSTLTKSELNIVAYHEAGHITVAELLNKSSVTISSIGGEEEILGFTNIYQESQTYSSTESIKNKICVLLGGKAAVELLSGKIDTNAESDINEAHSLARTLISRSAYYGFDKFNYYLDNFSSNSKFVQETTISNELTNLYNQTKSILFENIEFLKEISNTLLEKTTITQNEIAPIRNKYLN